MKKLNILFLTPLFAVFVLSSCGKYAPEDVELVKLGAKQKIVEVASDAGNCSFEVISNVEYTKAIISGNSWLSFSQIQEEGRVSLDFRANTGIKRVARIVLEHGTRSDTLQVRQKALAGMDEYLSLAQNSATIEPSGGTVSIAVSTNVPRSILQLKSYDDAIKALKLENDVLTFRADSNRTNNPVNTVVKVSFINGWEEEQSASVKVYQNFL